MSLNDSDNKGWRLIEPQPFAQKICTDANVANHPKTRVIPDEARPTANQTCANDSHALQNRPIQPAIRSPYTTLIRQEHAYPTMSKQPCKLW